MPDGRYGATVTITRVASGALVASRRFPAPQRFADAAQAVGHARAWAIDWIERHAGEGCERVNDD